MAEDGPREDGVPAPGPGGEQAGGDALPALEQWPEDEGRAPHVRPEGTSILRLLLRASPRVGLAILLAFLYTAAEGATSLAFLLSWLVVVTSMLMPRWRRYIETGDKHKPAPSEPLIVEAEEPASTVEADDEDAIDPRDAWDLPDDLPGEPEGRSGEPANEPGGPAKEPGDQQ
jgi:hypothetical protein